LSHSFACNRLHCVFSTKERKPLIPEEMEPRLHKFVSVVAAKRGIKVIAIGGTPNHIHILIGLPATMTLADAIQAIKGVSSKWLNEQLEGGARFAWQQGYGAFSVSSSHVDATIAYIRNQKEHHATRTFEQEFIAFLKKNNVDYDPQFVFG
jgi:REP element-mobilizing transposase RayT